VVRTVRAPGRFAGLRIGQRFVVMARPLGDGTFAAAGLHALWPARAARCARSSSRTTSTNPEELEDEPEPREEEGGGGADSSGSGGGSSGSGGGDGG
jgi:hypothetical protein